MIKFIPLWTVSGLLLIAGPVTAEEHRQLGAHAHGHGTLDVAIEGATVSMELEVPGADIVGFEHVAATPEQKAKVEKASAILAKPLDLFKLPTAAGCTTTSAKVEARAEEDDDDGKSGAKGKSDAKGKDGPAHSEFHVAYTLTCSAPDKLQTIDFAYFTAFAGAQKLTVNMVTSKAQSKFEVGRDKPVLDLGGVM
jgi:hypothetical protein